MLFWRGCIKNFQRRRIRDFLTKNILRKKNGQNINRLVDDMDGFFDETFRKELLRFGSEAELAKALKKSENKVKKLQKKIDRHGKFFIFKNWKSNYLCSAKAEKMLH